MKKKNRFIALCIGVMLFLPTTGLLGQSTEIDKGEQEKQEPHFKVVVADRAEKLGFDVKKLAVIDRKFRTLVRDEKIAGCSALIFRKGEQVYSGVWGCQDFETQVPLAEDSIFRIYSMSKPITSVAVMQLVEQDKIDLDAPVSTYLPEFVDLNVLEAKNGKSTEVAARRAMTTRDLLRHTSGLTYGFFGDTEVDQRYRKAGVLMTDIDLKSTIGKLSKIPLLNHPGAQFHYSASTDVLGRVVEVVSKQSFDDYLNENVFGPLGMEDTFFTVPTNKQDRFAQLYKPAIRGKLKPANALQSFRFFNQRNRFFSGGGGLCSTSGDYQRFCEMLLNSGELDGKRLLNKKTVKQMFTNQLVKIDNPPGRQFEFGLGFRIFPKGDYGWGGAAGTRFWVNPEKDTTIIFMIQIMPYGSRSYGNIVRDAAYAAMR